MERWQILRAFARGDATAAEDRLLAAMDILPAEGFREPDRFIVRTNLRVQAALHGWERAEGRARLEYPAYPDPDHWFGKAGDGLVKAAEAVRRGDGAGALAHLDEAFPPGIMPIGWRVLDDLLRGLAHELEGRPAPATRHLGRVADRDRAVFSFMTKERIHLAMAEEALARVTPTAPP